MFFLLRHISRLVNNHFITDSHYVNEAAVADTDEAYSNNQDETSTENKNVIDLLTNLTKSTNADA